MSEVALPGNWSLSGVEVAIRDPALSYEDFVEICARLGTMHRTIKEAEWEIKFAIGDAINAGEQTFGQRSYQAFEEFGMSEEVMGDCARVSQRVPRSIRRVKDGLSWSHHRAVAALPPPEQKEWLKRASDESMSHHDMRAALRNGQIPQAREACPSCGRPL